MGRRNRRSRTRSSTSAASRPKLPPIFLDENLAGKRLPEGLRKDGLTVKLLHEEFQRGILDSDLLPRIGKQGWIMLTKDNQIRRRPLEIEAFIEARLRVFVFESAEMTSEEMLGAFRKALPAIGRFGKKAKATVCHASRGDRSGDGFVATVSPTSGRTRSPAYVASPRPRIFRYDWNLIPARFSLDRLALQEEPS